MISEAGVDTSGLSCPPATPFDPTLQCSVVDKAYLLTRVLNQSIPLDPAPTSIKT